MDPSQLLREARQLTGLDQRRLAALSGVSVRTVADAETGRRRLSAHTLDALLAACGLDLALVHRDDVGDCPALLEHLRRSTTARLHLSLGGDGADLQTGPPCWHDLVRLAASEIVLLDGPAAVGTWLPGLRAPVPVVVNVRAAARRAPHPETPALVVRVSPRPRSTDPWTRAVRVGVPGRVAVLVPPPAELLLDATCEQFFPELRAAARCLHRNAGRDSGGRRAPPHRQPDEDNEGWNLGRSLDQVLLSEAMPVTTDSRGWRLDAPVSLGQWLADRGCPRRRGDSRPASRRT